MIIGVPKEIKEAESRVAVTPAGVRELCKRGHKVLVEENAGRGSWISDEDYRQAGAVISQKKAIFDQADMIVKVKEPLPKDIELLRDGQLVFTYLHLAADKELTEQLLHTKIIGIAYETVEVGGALPLLAPMSAIAGRLAIQLGAHHLESAHGGRGVLLGGVPGVAPAEVMILGTGVVSLNAAKMAVGAGADVTVVGHRNVDRLAYFDDIFSGRIKTVMFGSAPIASMLEHTDLLVSGILIPGKAAPKMITREMVKRMRPGSVIVDVSVDQGGVCETTRPTSHLQPTYVVDGVIHCNITNMPGVVARTSTFALTNATLPYVLELADKGFSKAVSGNPGLYKGVNLFKGHLTCLPVSESLSIPYTPLEKLAHLATNVA